MSEISVDRNPLTGVVVGERVGQPVTKEELMDAAGLSFAEFYIEKAEPRCWPTSMKVEGFPAQIWNHRLALWVKPIHDEIVSREIRDTLLADIRAEVRTSGKRPKIKVSKAKSAIMGEIDIFDSHFQKLAWGPETGTNYDVKIAADEYRKAAYELIAEVREWGRPIESCLFPIGQDLFHTDNEDYRTAAGTRQDVDGRLKKSARVVRALLTEVIGEMLRDAPVHVVNVPGNHGPERDWWMGEVIDARFENDPNVTVDNRPVAQKLVHYGKNLIGYAHGKDEKPKDLKDFMVHDAGAAWHESTFRVWRLGHLHHEWEIKDIHGMLITYMPSLSGTDAWHRNSGYAFAMRGARAHIWTKDRGCRHTINYYRPRTVEEMAFTEPLRVG